MKRNKKKNTKLVLLLLLICITLGYAALRTGLNINGTTKISNATWDVHFENVEATENSNVTPTVAPSAPAESKLTEISYDVSFTEPGEIYEFTVDVKNAGTIDAMVESIETKLKVGDAEEEVLTASNLPSYLNYAVTYTDDVEIQNDHLLASNTSEKINVRVEFKRDITNDELAKAANKVIKFTLSLNYMQADENATESHPEPTNYVVSTEMMQIGQPLPNGVTLKTKAFAKADWVDIAGSEQPIYLKHKLNGSDEISESYACFERNSTEYCIKGGDSGTAFLSNAKIIYDAFGGVGCTGDDNLPATYDSSYNPSPASNFNCSVSGLSVDDDSYVDADSYGYVHVGYGWDCDCHVFSDGSSYCVQVQE